MELYTSFILLCTQHGALVCLTFTCESIHSKEQLRWAGTPVASLLVDAVMGAPVRVFCALIDICRRGRKKGDETNEKYNKAMEHNEGKWTSPYFYLLK